VKDFDRFGPSLPMGADYTKNQEGRAAADHGELAAKLELLTVGKEPYEKLLGIPSSHGWKKIKEDYGTAEIHDTTEGSATSTERRRDPGGLQGCCNRRWRFCKCGE
jgi:hypothetical protein